MLTATKSAETGTARELRAHLAAQAGKEFRHLLAILEIELAEAEITFDDFAARYEIVRPDRAGGRPWQP